MSKKHMVLFFVFVQGLVWGSELSSCQSKFLPKISAPDLLYFDGKPNRTVDVSVSKIPPGCRVKVFVRLGGYVRERSDASITWKSVYWKGATGVAMGLLNHRWTEVSRTESYERFFSGKVRFHLYNFGDNMVAIESEWRVETY